MKKKIMTLVLSGCFACALIATPVKSTVSPTTEIGQAEPLSITSSMTQIGQTDPLAIRLMTQIGQTDPL